MENSCWLLLFLILGENVNVNVNHGEDPEKAQLKQLVKTYEAEIASLKDQLKKANDLISQLQSKATQQTTAAAPKKEEKADDFDLFGEEDEEAEKERERIISERAAASIAAKKVNYRNCY